MRQLFLRPELWDDLAEAIRWYEQQLPGARHEIEAEFRQATDLALKFGESMRVIVADVRRVRLKRFPYSIYFRVTDTQVRVLLLWHQARNPQTLNALLKRRA